jgi:hypothetical protein
MWRGMKAVRERKALNLIRYAWKVKMTCGYNFSSLRAR